MTVCLLAIPDNLHYFTCLGSTCNIIHEPGKHMPNHMPIRKYGSNPYIGMTQSVTLTQFKDQARIIFSHVRPSRLKYLFLKILFFSLLSQNFKSLPRKTTEIQPFTILAFSSGLFIHHLLHDKTKFLRSIYPKRCDIESWNMGQNV